MIRATTLERILLILSDFAALSICFALAFWVQFHSGWILDKYDPSKTFVSHAAQDVVTSSVDDAAQAFDRRTEQTFLAKTMATTEGTNAQNVP